MHYSIERLGSFAFVFDLHVINASLAIKAVSDNFIGSDKLIKLFLEVIVLKSEQISVILQSMELLFVARTRFEECLVALSDGFKLSAECLKFIVVANIG